MATITDSTIRTTAWEVLYDVLAAGTYTSSTAPGFYRNNSDIDQDDTFPRIVLMPLRVDSKNMSFGRSKFMNEIKVIIDIWADKNKDLDILGDEVTELLRTTKFTGLNYIGSDEALTIETDVNQKLHLRTITATFSRG